MKFIRMDYYVVITVILGLVLVRTDGHCMHYWWKLISLEDESVISVTV